MRSVGLRGAGGVRVAPPAPARWLPRRTRRCTRRSPRCRCRRSPRSCRGDIRRGRRIAPARRRPMCRITVLPLAGNGGTRDGLRRLCDRRRRIGRVRARRRRLGCLGLNHGGTNERQNRNQGTTRNRTVMSAANCRNAATHDAPMAAIVAGYFVANLAQAGQARGLRASGRPPR